MSNQRRALHTYLEIDSHETWWNVANSMPASMSGLLEALAYDMRQHPPDKTHPRWSELVKIAQHIDVERRRRA